MVVDDRYDDNSYDDGEYDGETYYEEDDGGWPGGVSVGLLLIVGIILFFFPEPITTTIGIVLIGLAVVMWVTEIFM